MAKYLILYGADVNVRSLDGMTAFDLAASFGRVCRIRYLSCLVNGLKI